MAYPGGSTIGRIGEETARKYLEDKGFSIVARNYRKKWGEIDIVARKGGVVHFVEVKSVSCENLESAFDAGGQRPEENVHPQKQKRLARAIQSYLMSGSEAGEAEWQFDIAVVFLDEVRRQAKIRYLSDIVL